MQIKQQQLTKCASDCDYAAVKLKNNDQSVNLFGNELARPGPGRHGGEPLYVAQ